MKAILMACMIYCITANPTAIDIASKGFVSFHEFIEMSSEQRVDVLNETWSLRHELIEMIGREGYEKPKEKFYHIYHQMLLVDSELNRIHPVLKKEREREFKDF